VIPIEEMPHSKPWHEEGAARIKAPKDMRVMRLRYMTQSWRWSTGTNAGWLTH
tara:strand:+ start:246 stop:404 length:159 start_codon:yes stop_codon:yes gene_type:complete